MNSTFFSSEHKDKKSVTLKANMCSPCKEAQITTLKVYSMSPQSYKEESVQLEITSEVSLPENRSFLL